MDSNSWQVLGAVGKEGKSSLVSCTAVCPIPVPSSVHLSVHLIPPSRVAAAVPVQWPKHICAATATSQSPQSCDLTLATFSLGMA